MHMANVSAKPGKTLLPKMAATIHSPSTLFATPRKQSGWTMKDAIRRYVDDMTGILDSGDRKATTFLPAELESLPDHRSWPDAERVRLAGDGRANQSGRAPLAWQGGGQ